jgi:hypothetical protein
LYEEDDEFYKIEGVFLEKDKIIIEVQVLVSILNVL